MVIKGKLEYLNGKTNQKVSFLVSQKVRGTRRRERRREKRRENKGKKREREENCGARGDVIFFSPSSRFPSDLQVVA